MLKTYHCAKCGTECRPALHAQLQLTKAGVSNARQMRRHFNAALGHLCRICALEAVRTVLRACGHAASVPPALEAFLASPSPS